jgi:hypothetical protein
MNHETFSKLPDAALDQLRNSQASQEPQGTQGSQSADEDIFSTGKHTENSTGPENSQGPKSAPLKSSTIGGKFGANGAKFAVKLINLLIPAVLCFIISKMGYSLSKDSLKLNAEERELVEPALQDVLNDIVINFDSPYVNLALVLGVVYTAKLGDVFDQIKKKEPDKKETAKVVDMIVEAAAKKKPSFDELYESRYQELIKEIQAQRKRGKPDAINHAKKTGATERLHKQITKELNAMS